MRMMLPQTGCWGRGQCILSFEIANFRKFLSTRDAAHCPHCRREGRPLGSQALAAFAILPLRGVLYTLSDNPYWLVGAQLLDCVCAGLFGALTPLLLADLMRGTGRYNLSQGAVGTVQGVGASLSNVVAGMIVTVAGYDTAYLVLAATAFVAFAVFFLAMPETREPLTSAEFAGPCQGAE